MIRHDGSVFPCCADQDHTKLGNINNQHLSEIINNDAIQKLRDHSINSNLACYENCNLVNDFPGLPIDLNNLSNQSHLEEYKELQIEYGELCNVDCVMCWQDRSNTKTLSLNALTNNVPLKHWKRILALGGEVFLMDSARAHLEEIFQSHPGVVEITTNGLVLGSKKTREKLIKHVKDIRISINATNERSHYYVMRPKKPFYNIVLENVRLLRHERNNFKDSNLVIRGQFTAISETLFEIPQFMDSFMELGFEYISITFDHSKFPDFFLKNPETTKSLAKKIQDVYDNSSHKERIEISDYGLLLRR